MSYNELVKHIFMSKPWYLEYDNFEFEIEVKKLSISHSVICRYTKKKDGSPANEKDAFKSIFRFFNEIVWFHQGHISDINGGTSQGSHVSLNYRVRGEEYLPGFKQRVFEDRPHLALAFYREAECNESPYYRFLCFSKILETPFKKKEAPLKVNWIKQQILNLEDSIGTHFRDRKMATLKDKTLEDWLYEDGRHAIAHANEGRLVRDPNNYDDWQDIVWANTIMEELARKTITQLLNVPPP
ncbi:MAG: hypothetical protein H3C49_05510 [Alphaproteobacteria bacterium]|nr:hypothetical protein [Alphaproteobacteria bacterium]